MTHDMTPAGSNTSLVTTAPIFSPNSFDYMDGFVKLKEKVMVHAGVFITNQLNKCRLMSYNKVYPDGIILNFYVIIKDSFVTCVQ